MSEPIGKSQPNRHAAGVQRFLDMPLEMRYAAMGIGPWTTGHIADEVMFAVARRAEAEKWPDKRKYSQEFIQRVYRHVEAHVKTNLAWQRHGGGLDATSDDCAQYVMTKLATVPADADHAEVAFGDIVYKRSLDFADTLFGDYQKKRVANDPEEDEYGGLSDTSNADKDPDTSPEELDERYERESHEDHNLDRIYALIQEEGFLTDHERIAFTYHWIGRIQIHSKNADKLTVCKLMDRSDKSVRIYIDSAMAKIKERLQ